MTQLCQGMPSVLYEKRYCNQDDFNVVICGDINKVTELKGPNFDISAKLPPMLKPKISCRTAAIGSDIYVFGGYVGVDDWSSSVEMLSAKTNTWKEMESKTTDCLLTNFSVCSFVKSIYIIGGRFRYKDYHSTDSSEFPDGCYIEK